MSLSEKTDEEILKLANPIMDNLMDGSAEINWEKHTRDLTERARGQITREELERQCNWYQSRFGNFTSREFLGITRHQDYVNVLWKQKVSKSPNEYTATLSLIADDDRYLVDRCWVDLWEPRSEPLGAQ